ncbi:MAG: class I SAM-dependent RNA methyltransferase [bacterium]|nr:class I SAM-dependent RNA methyltransferase [bacterium]
MSDINPKGNSSTPAKTVEVRIEKILNQGDGLGRLEGQAVFVPLTAPGDLVRANIIKQGRGFVQTTLDEVLEASPSRQEAPCPHYGLCGGCNLQHIKPEAQRLAKAEIVTECFSRLGKLDISEIIQGPTDSGKELGYRNRIRVFANPAGHYGLMQRASHNVIALDSCPLLPDLFNNEILPWLRMMPPVEQIVIRLDGKGGWLLSMFGPSQRMRILKKIVSALPDGESPAPGCTGLLFNNRPIWGKDFLINEVSGHKFRVSSQSFFQGNIEATEEAIDLVRQWLSELSDQDQLGPLLGDLYCGVGLFSLGLADLFEKVVAIDSNPHGIRDALNNVRRSDTAKGKVEVIEGALGKVLADGKVASSNQWKNSCCVVDPPRVGLGKEGVLGMLKLSPRHLIYMSCDPATMARDVALLTENRYRIVKLQVLDMFPQTAHVETLMLLEKKS